MSVHCTGKVHFAGCASFRLLFLLVTNISIHGRNSQTTPYDKLRWSVDIHRTLHTFYNNRLTELWVGGHLSKDPLATLSTGCHLATWRIKRQTGVRGCTFHMLTKTRLAASEIAVLIMTYRTQNINCRVTQDYYHIIVVSRDGCLHGTH